MGHPSDRVDADNALTSAVPPMSFQAFVHGLPQLLWTASAEGLLTWANERFNRFLGMPVEEARACAWRGIIHDSDYERMWETWNRAREACSPYEIELRMRNADTGEYRWLLIRAEPVLSTDGAVMQWVGCNTDVHRQKQVEEEARESERRYQVLANGVPQMVWTADADGAVTWANRLWQEYTGQSIADVSGDGWKRVIHPDDYQRTLDTYLHCIATGEGYAIEHRWRSAKTGQYRWFLGRALPVRDAAGRIVQWLGTTTDINEDKRLRDELQESEARARFLAEAGALLGSTLDYELTLREVSRMAVPRIADWCAIDLLDDKGVLRRVSVHHQDPDKVKLAKQLHTQYPPGPNDIQYRVMDKGTAEFVPAVDDATLLALARDDDHLRIIRSLNIRSWIVSPLRLREQSIGVLILVADSDRSLDEQDRQMAEDLAARAASAIERSRIYKESQAARTEAETLLEVARALAEGRELQQIVQVATDAATRLCGAQFGAFFYNVLNPDGGSYMLYTLSGVPKEEFSRFPLPRATALFGPTFRGEGVVRLSDVRADPRFGKSAPYYGLPPGHLPVVSYLAVPVVSRRGEVYGGLFFGHPAADRFSVRHERLAVGIAGQAAIAIESIRLLEDERHARSVAASQAEELSRANAELKQFVYIASHDLQEPLRTVTQFLDLADLRGGSEIPERIRRYITMAKDSASRMYDLINDLLAYSRLASDEEPASQVDLAELVREVTADLSATIEESGAAITLGELPMVTGDRTRLRLLLQNLLGNALKFRGDKPPQVHIAAQREGPHLIVVVRDNGIGIDPAHHSRIFEIFQRLHARERYPGTGMGLAICKKIVERHGGTIWVESQPGQGSAFHFRLPIAENT
jgi:PAS domain S-box-containing protein